ncbi:MAG: DUF2147 domain-containing protein [Bacteroidetes bacterium]|jgi:uncharacterized protein (DUF2147 family)|nr:DUF2147 domain-containing protein [Bacteroidota bacterium]
MNGTILTFLTVFFTVNYTIAQEVYGKWKTIDDITGEAKSIVEIYKKNGKAYGKVVEILNPEKRNDKCINCTGADKNKPILGMEILKDLKKNGSEYSGGTITDPNTGKIYKALMELENPNKLKVRGYIGFSLMGRSQYWERFE